MLNLELFSRIGGLRYMQMNTAWREKESLFLALVLRHEDALCGGFFSPFFLYIYPPFTWTSLRVWIGSRKKKRLKGGSIWD